MSGGSARKLALSRVIGAIVAVVAVGAALAALAAHGCGRTPLGPVDPGAGATTGDRRGDAGGGWSPAAASAAAASGRGAGGAGPALLDGAGGGTVRFAVIGDYGVNNSSEGRVAAMVARWNPDFVITAGDNNYPVGAAETMDDNIGKYYSAFIGSYRGRHGAGSAVNRFWPSPGNHDWGTGTLQPYLDYFTLPGNERYYDVDQGLVHLYAIDSDAKEPDGATADSIQATWLRERLAASRACFDIVYFHHPPYSSGSVHGGLARMRWPFAAWGAELVVAGHDHIYERLEVGGIPYLVVGSSGRALYGIGAVDPHSQARLVQDYGALLVTADRRGITFEYFYADGTRTDAHRWSKDCP